MSQVQDVNWNERTIVFKCLISNVTFQGKTEYESKFKLRSDDESRAPARTNHSITKQIVENHLLRQSKYKAKCSDGDGGGSDKKLLCYPHLKITGNSEYRTNYKIDEDEFKKHKAIRQDKRVDEFRLNPFSNLFSGRSEYVHSFQDPVQAGPKRRQVDLRINPVQEYDNPVAHRPYATYNRKTNITETHESHSWPVKEDRAFRYEWLNNKCN